VSYRLLSLLTERASVKLGQRGANLAAAYSGLEAAGTNAVAIRNACSASCTFYASQVVSIGKTDTEHDSGCTESWSR